MKRTLLSMMVAAAVRGLGAVGTALMGCGVYGLLTGAVPSPSASGAVVVVAFVLGGAVGLGKTSSE